MSTWSEISKQKILTPDTIKSKVEELRKNGKTIATLNGSFDLLHAGHLHILFEAKKQADILIILLNSDRSIQTYKSKSRPIIPLKERMELMGALEFVDYVTYFEETDPRKLLEIIKPDVHINGAEYGPNCIEAETVQNHGGKLHLVNKIPGLSTSAICKKIQGTLSCD